MNTFSAKEKFTAVVCTGMILASLSTALGQDAAPANNDSLVRNIPYTSENLRDPFEGYIQKKTAPLPASQLIMEENFVPPPLTISGITWGSSFPQAIVNGKVVKAGDMINDVQVVSISKQGIVFLYNNQQFSMPAPGAKSTKQEGVKTP